MACLNARVLAATRLLEVVDVHCTAPKSGWGTEESAQRTRLVLPRRGVFAWQTRGETYLAEPGCLLNFEPGEPHRFSHPTDGGDDCMLIVISDETWAEVVNSRALRRCVHLQPPRHYEGALLYQAAARYGHADSLLFEEVSVPLIEGFFDILTRTDCSRLVGKRRAVANHRRLVEAARAYVSANFCARDALSDIARQLHSSPFHLARVFRAHTGITLHRHRNHLRLAAALRALEEGCEDLAELALRLGYASHAHFSTAFGAAFGSSPSAARQVLTRATLSDFRRLLRRRP